MSGIECIYAFMMISIIRCHKIQKNNTYDYFVKSIKNNFLYNIPNKNMICMEENSFLL